MSDEITPAFMMGAFDKDPDTDMQNVALDALPILATRNLVLFPDVTIPLMLVRENSLAVAQAAADNNIPVGIVCQLKADSEPGSDISKINKYGVLAEVLQVIELPENHHTALVRGLSRIHLMGPAKKGAECPIQEARLKARVKIVSDMPLPGNPESVENQALVGTLRNAYDKLVKESEGEATSEFTMPLHEDMPASLIINTVATMIKATPDEKIPLLSAYRLHERAMGVIRLLMSYSEKVHIEKTIRDKARNQMDEQGRNAFLQQQLESIREELYGEDGNEDVATLRTKADTLTMPPEARAAFDKELNRLKHQNPQSPDYALSLSYLETILDLPWGVETPVNTDFAEAEKALNADHYGLDKVKERILEQLAVMLHNPEGRSPIICMVGAPGVGKTSLGQSIAKALGREYQRVSLGGLHDEAELRGHRRTYIGAMPGRIIEALRRAKTANPVLVLDEVDKIGADYKGDPAAALLEVLDPEQNCHFHDNYIDIDFDLSRVLFVATANTLQTLSQPLLDRMEIIELSGYLPQEKMEIARRHLLPRVLKAHNVKEGQITFSDSALEAIIERYTAESGVRQLEKSISKIVRKYLLEQMREAKGKKKQLTQAQVKAEDLKHYLGLEPHIPEKYEGNEMPGVVTGLAWTPVGGEILLIESSLVESTKGDTLTLTGNLGDVMKESAMIALQWVRSHARELGIDPSLFEQRRVHLHVPEGAIPKDGPSAGITMAASLTSTFTGRRPAEAIAMTGEITLRGRVLPVGGIKEKLLAARRAGIKTIIISEENRRDVEDIRPEYLEGLRFVYVRSALEAVEAALLPQQAPV